MSGIHRPALLKWAGSVDPLFHMSWATKYLVISYPTGIWELHFRPGELNCTYELKYRPQKYVGYDKTRFSVTPAHMKRAGHPLPLVSKERKILTSSATLVWAVIHLYPAGKKRKLTVENKLIKNWTKNTQNMILGIESFLNYYLFLSQWRWQLNPSVYTYNRNTFGISISVPFLKFENKYH
jgi:hypothetical protein